MIRELDDFGEFSKMFRPEDLQHSDKMGDIWKSIVQDDLLSLSQPEKSTHHSVIEAHKLESLCQQKIMIWKPIKTVMCSWNPLACFSTDLWFLF